MKFSKIQIRLTISYLFTMLMVIVILLMLTIGGYYLYLKTDIAARWAGEQALSGARDLVYWIDSDQLDLVAAQDYVLSTYGDLKYEDASQIITMISGEMALVFDLDGYIIASSNVNAFPLNKSIMDGSVQGVSVETIRDKTPKITYQNLGRYHTGQAPILNQNNQLIGWFFYKTEGDDVNSLIQTIAGTLALPALFTIIPAMLVSGIMGLLFARSFTKQIFAIQTASRDFAAGRLEKRISLKGSDEFTELSMQFNRMADQLQKQLRDLRDLADKNALLAEEARQLAVLEERNHLAGELHDAVKQELFGLNLMLGSIKATAKSSPEAAVERINQTIIQVQDIQNELDHIIKALHPASLQDLGLIPALQVLASRMSIPLNLQVHSARSLPLQVEKGIYRIAQEALQNIIKHATATKVDMSLTFTNDEVALTISDDGKGFDETSSIRADALGLHSMRARAQAMQAVLSIESQAGHGTTLFLKVPLKDIL